MTNIAGTGAVTVGNDGAFVLTTSTTDEDLDAAAVQARQFRYSTTLNLLLLRGSRSRPATPTTDALLRLASVDTTVVTAARCVDVDDGIFFFKGRHGDGLDRDRHLRHDQHHGHDRP